MFAGCREKPLNNIFYFSRLDYHHLKLDGIILGFHVYVENQNGNNLRKNTFSNIFKNIVSKLTGLYNNNILPGLFGLKIIITSAHFHCEGK